MIFRPDSRRYDYQRFGLEWPWDHLGQCSFPIFDRLLKTRKQMRAIFSCLNDNINVKIVFNFYKLFLSSFTTSVGLKPATVSFTVMNTVYTSHTRSLKEPSIIPAFTFFEIFLQIILRSNRGTDVFYDQRRKCISFLDVHPCISLSD